MKSFRWPLSILCLGVFYFSPVVTQYQGFSTMAYATEKVSKNSARKSKKVPAMRNRVYTQLARAQKLADEGDKIEGFDVLDTVKDRIDSLNSYEKAMLWNFYGFMYYGNDDIALAIDSFENVIAQEAIPESLYLSTLFSLAQLNMQQQNFKQTLITLKKWQLSNNKPLNSSQQMLFAQVYYQDKKYQTSLEYIKKAMEYEQHKRKKLGKVFIPQEQWLILQRANYFELKQTDQVTQVIEMLVRFHSKPKYWLQLSAMYGEIGQEDKQLAVMEAAWQAGYIKKSTDIITLAQLYRYHDVPFKAAMLLSEAIDQGFVTAEEKTFAMLAQSYIAAKNDEQAIPVLMKASDICDNGKFDAQLAQAYLNLGQWKKAISFADKAIIRGFDEEKKSQLGAMYLIKGMAKFNLQQFEQALMALAKAKNYKSVKKNALQWFQYVKKEQGHQQRLAMLN
jgi:tetratricopeptide (TPR) repeat protein